jgi:NAD(P)-dependent dehydrogenase (short-subunit alcohol dehydrogenase family)
MPSILITGANRGLGLEFARQYAQAGWEVIATCRNPAKAAALNKLGVEVMALDVADLKSINELGHKLGRRPIDVLLNNAGIYGEDQNFGRIDVGQWEKVFRVNTMAPLKLAEALLPNVLAGRKRLMVFITSLMGSIADNSGGGSYIYRSSKAALNAAVKSLSVDLAWQGVTALLLHPGWVQTDMGGKGAPTQIPDSIAGMRQVIEAVHPGQPLRYLDYRGAALPW